MKLLSYSISKIIAFYRRNTGHLQEDSSDVDLEFIAFILVAIFTIGCLIYLKRFFFP